MTKTLRPRYHLCSTTVLPTWQFINHHETCRVRWWDKVRDNKLVVSEGRIVEGVVLSWGRVVEEVGMMSGGNGYAGGNYKTCYNHHA